MANFKWQTVEERAQEMERLAQEAVKDKVTNNDLRALADVILVIVDVILKIPLLPYDLKSKLESLKGRLAL